MATWDIVASWSSGNLVLSDPSGNEILTFDGDLRTITIPSGAGITMSAGSTFDAVAGTVNVPEIRCRVDMDLTYLGSSSGGGVVNSVANPTTQTLWVEECLISVETASSSSSYISVQIGSVASSSGSGDNIIVDATVGGSTAGRVLMNSSGTTPAAWSSTSYLTCYVTSSSDGSAGLDGTISVFCVTAVGT